MNKPIQKEQFVLCHSLAFYNLKEIRLLHGASTQLNNLALWFSPKCWINQSAHMMVFSQVLVQNLSVSTIHTKGTPLIHPVYPLNTMNETTPGVASSLLCHLLHSINEPWKFFHPNVLPRAYNTCLWQMAIRTLFCWAVKESENYFRCFELKYIYKNN